MRGRGKTRASVPSSARKRSHTACSSHQSGPLEGQAVSELAVRLFVPHRDLSYTQLLKANLGSPAYRSSPDSCRGNSSLWAKAETRLAQSSPREQCCFHRRNQTLV